MSSEKIIFVEIFQPFAQYRNPFTFYYAQTYPLPPKSTIVGMLQNAIGDWYGNKFIGEWSNIKVSVHGGFESVFWNYQCLIKDYVEIRKLDKIVKLYNQNLPLYNYNGGKTSQRTPVTQQELFNGHLYIFIKGNSNLIDKIKEALERPTKVLYLGRSEDIVFIRDVKEIQPEKNTEAEGDIKIKYPTYILLNGFPIYNQKYPVYTIPTKIEFKNNEKNVTHKSEITKNTERIVEFTTVIYTSYDYSILLKENEKVRLEIYKIKNKKISIINPYGWL